VTLPIAAFLRGFRAFSSGIVQNVITMGWVIYGMTTIITTLTGLNEWLAISICIAVALTYATAAGFYGVVITDVVQFAIATVSMMVLAVASVRQIGGLANILDTIKTMPGYGEHTLAIFPDVTKLNHDLTALIVFLGLLGLLCTAFLAAFMSTIDTHLNWGASYLMNDVYHRFLRPRATRKEYMLATRFATVGLMIR